MRGLSGGQKVKVVLGAAMWNNPHMLVLDEPTNYLDRDSLGALSEAIKSFGGGVIMITHNQEFSNAICSETWTVENGRMTPTGQVRDWRKCERTHDAHWTGKLWGIARLPPVFCPLCYPCEPITEV